MLGDGYLFFSVMKVLLIDLATLLAAASMLLLQDPETRAQLGNTMIVLWYPCLSEFV